MSGPHRRIPPHRKLGKPAVSTARVDASAGGPSKNNHVATPALPPQSHQPSNAWTKAVVPDTEYRSPETNNAWTDQPNDNVWTDPNTNHETACSSPPVKNNNNDTDQNTKNLHRRHANDSRARQLDGAHNRAAVRNEAPPEQKSSPAPGRGRRNQHGRKPDGQSKPTQPKRKKKASPWISDKEIRAMDLAAPYVPKKFDEGGAPDPNLFWAWPGEKATPPVWDDRLLYKDPNLHDSIMNWLGKVDSPENPLGTSVNRDFSSPQGANFSFTVDQASVRGGRLFFLPPKQHDHVFGDVVPRAWIPDTLKFGQNLQDFWNELIRAGPKPQDESDLLGWKPFWERYLSPDAGVQMPYHQPQHKGCDTTRDTPDDSRQRRQDQGGQGWIRLYQSNPNAFMLSRFGRKAGPSSWERRAEREAKEKAEYEKAAKELEAKELAEQQGHASPEEVAKSEAPAMPEVEIVDDTIRPKINVYIRMAQPIDFPQIANIYNHYIQNSVCTPELGAVSSEDMLNRFNRARSTHLPFIVCCSRRARGRGKKKTNLVTDEVVGFAYADDYHSPRAALRFTVEMAVFVTPTKKRCGVSRCLLDKIIALLDQYHVGYGGYDVDDQLGLGVHRLVSRLILNWLHVEDDEAKGWLIPYLQSWGFEEVGHLRKVAYKLNQVVDMKTFCRDTGLVIVPTNPPLAPLSDH